jgi:hypothetical protein
MPYVTLCCLQRVEIDESSWKKSMKLEKMSLFPHEDVRQTRLRCLLPSCPFPCSELAYFLKKVHQEIGQGLVATQCLKQIPQTGL